MTTGRIIDPSSDLWREALDRSVHDFYHLPCYATLTAERGESPLAFIASSGEHRMLAPFLQRPLPLQISDDRSLSDVVSPYGYPGPIWSRGAPEAFKQESLYLLRDTLRSAGVISAFFRLHPLITEVEPFSLFGQISPQGPTVYIDLSASEEDLWRGTRGGHRREIRQLERRGYTAVIDEDWSQLDAFISCYRQTMDRVKASPFYYFPKKYFLDLRQCLGSQAKLCLVHIDGEVACAGIMTEMDGIAQNHLAGTADAHLSAHPSKLMLHFQRTWLKAHGHRFFHIGGGVGGREDSLFDFKIGFSRLHKPYNTWRIVTDTAKYDERVQHWLYLNGGPPQPSQDFFPQYRAPVVTSRR